MFGIDLSQPAKIDWLEPLPNIPWNKGLKGDYLDPETRARVSKMGGAAMRAKGVSAEHRAKLSAALKGRVVSAETRANISAAAKARPPRGRIAYGRRIREWAEFFGVDQSTVRQQIVLGRFPQYYEKKTGKKFEEAA